MNEQEFFRTKGGVLAPMALGLMAGNPDDMPEQWNFGIRAPTTKSVRMRAARPTFHERFPKMKGKWDGETVNHHDAVKAVLGKFLPAHNQPRGTCGGRAGSRSLELLQCILIASGKKKAKFKYVSHAAVYMFARMKYDMAKGSPSDENNDGVAGGAVPEILAEMGVINRDECEDKSFAGVGSDDLACAWGCGKIDPAKLAAIKEMARDNIVTERVRLTSWQECADLLASGGVICQSDGQGFTMTRDANGFCSAKGVWWHYQTRSGVRTVGNKVGFQYDQSWGDDTPQGPAVPGCPGNVFLVDKAVQDKVCKNGEVDGLIAFDPWDVENGKVDLEWIYP